jgi:hypothetical protein
MLSKPLLGINVANNDERWLEGNWIIFDYTLLHESDIR